MEINQNSHNQNINANPNNSLEVNLDDIDSLALARVLEDLNSCKGAYDRLHNRHNR